MQAIKTASVLAFVLTMVAGTSRGDAPAVWIGMMFRFARQLLQRESKMCVPELVYGMITIASQDTGPRRTRSKPRWSLESALIALLGSRDELGRLLSGQQACPIPILNR